MKLPIVLTVIKGSLIPFKVYIEKKVPCIMIDYNFNSSLSNLLSNQETLCGRLH